jgi:hypothetical protein
MRNLLRKKTRILNEGALIEIQMKILEYGWIRDKTIGT